MEFIMSMLVSCLFVAMLLPFISKIPLAFAMHKEGRYDNKHPRSQQAKLKGFGARALAAHQNSFESLIIFGLSVLLAIALGKTSDLIQYLALTHILARTAYHVFYLINWHILRSTVWFVGLISSLTIVWLCVP